MKITDIRTRGKRPTDAVLTRVSAGEEELVVDLVGEDAQGERLADGLVEAGEEVRQALALAAHHYLTIGVST